MRSLLLPISILATATGCVGAPRPETSVVAQIESSTAVIPMRPGDFAQSVFSERSEFPAIYKPKEQSEAEEANLNYVTAICESDANGNPPKPAGESFAIGLIGALLKPLFGLLFAKADKALDERIKAYKAEWSAGVTDSWFVGGEDGEAEPIVRCVRLMRITHPKGKPVSEGMLQFDAIFLVHSVPQHSAWQLVPLRVYTRDPVALGTEVKFAVSLSGNATTTIDGQGELKAIPETVILKGAFAKPQDVIPNRGEEKLSYPIKLCPLIQNHLNLKRNDSHATMTTCPSNKSRDDLVAKDKESPSPTAYPTSLVPNVAAMAVPGRVPSKKGAPGSALTLTFKVAEAGGGKGLKNLEDWKVFLGKAGDGLSGAMTSAITGLIDGKSE